MRNSMIITLLALVALMTQAQNSIPPFVYTAENTGSHFAPPALPAPDQLPIICELPDPLEGVNDFADWSRRRSDIGHMIQHYGIGKKPSMERVRWLLTWRVTLHLWSR